MEEVERLFDAYRSDPHSEDVRARWWALFQDANGSGYLRSAHVNAIARFVDLGWAIEKQAGNHSRAIEALQPYFHHPSGEQAHRVDHVAVNCQLGESLLNLGKEAEAVSIWRSLVESKDRFISRSGALYISSTLVEFFRNRPETQEASSTLTELVWASIRSLKPRLSDRNRPREGATYGELFELLVAYVVHLPASRE
jgi:hypothetical protein